MRTLKPSGFTLFMWLAANDKNGCQLELSPSKLVNEQIMARRSYYHALEDLKSNGYLVNNVFCVIRENLTTH